MNRFLLSSIFCLILLILPIAFVSASDDRAYTSVRLNKFEEVAIEAGRIFKVDVSGLIIPSFHKEGQIAGPDHEPTATWKDEFIQMLTPQAYKDDGKHIDWDANANPIYYTSYYGVILKTDAEHSNHPPPSDCYISTTFQKTPDIPFAPLDFQKAREADGWLGIEPIVPDASGVIDFNLPSVTIGGMNGSADCKRHDEAIERSPVEVDIKKFAQFGDGSTVQGHEITTIKILIREFSEALNKFIERWDFAKEMHKDDAILTEKKALPHYSVGCHDGGCPGSEAGPFSGNAAISGGYTAFLLREEDKKPLEDASLQPYHIKIASFDPKPFLANYDIRNQSEIRQKQAACYTVPDTSNNSTGKNLQDTAVMGATEKHQLAISEECAPKPKLNCPIDVIKEKAQPPGDRKCSVNGTGGIYTKNQTLSPLAIKVLETAADTYKVPASVLIGTMLLEGGFNHPDDWDWSSDENIEEYSDCNNPSPLPKCGEFAAGISTGSTAPFGFLPGTWDSLMSNGNPYEGPFLKAELDGLDEVVQGVTTFSACNFTDAAFMAARLISESSHALNSSVPESCTAPDPYGEIPMYKGSLRPESCSSWTADRVATARYQYGGGAFLGTCTAADPANSYNIGYLIDIWRALTP